MSEMSYTQVIEHYHQHTKSINELIGSILCGLNDPLIFNDEKKLKKTFSTLKKNYPFLEMIYKLDPAGKQISQNIGMEPKNHNNTEIGKDRSHRPYFLETQQESPSRTNVTSPYLSTFTRSLCISAASKIKSAEGILGYIVLDINLTSSIEFMMGDRLRSRFNIFFKSIFAIISIGLFSVVLLLFYLSLTELLSIFTFDNNKEDYVKPFGIIIYLTLALAIFDLAKTTLEEEVLMHKDIFRHSSTRRTITRFMSAILIAVSIESLLLMFKSVLSHDDMLPSAIGMMLSSALLLLALGAYVYLSAKAEAKMLESQRFIKSNL